MTLSPISHSSLSDMNKNLKSCNTSLHVASTDNATPDTFKAAHFKEFYEATGQVLGQGSFGLVSTYINKANKHEYAVKEVTCTDVYSRRKLLKEFQLLKFCSSHINILTVMELIEDETKMYCVYEKMYGGTLLESIRNRQHLTEYDASLVVRDIADALDFMHFNGITHRDLKPDNILCKSNTSLVPVCLCDFDLAAYDACGNSNSQLAKIFTPVGSAEFMAPEIIAVLTETAWSYDKRCDLWSLGIIIYVMLCGYTPFYGCCNTSKCDWMNGGFCTDCQNELFSKIQEGYYEFPNRDWCDISRQAIDLIKNLLVRDPEERYSAGDVLNSVWVNSNAFSNKNLSTPDLLSLNNVRKVESMATKVLAANRIVVGKFSIQDQRDKKKYIDFESEDEAHTQDVSYEVCDSQRVPRYMSRNETCSNATICPINMYEIAFQDDDINDWCHSQDTADDFLSASKSAFSSPLELSSGYESGFSYGNSSPLMEIKKFNFERLVKINKQEKEKEKEKLHKKDSAFASFYIESVELPSISESKVMPDREECQLKVNESNKNDEEEEVFTCNRFRQMSVRTNDSGIEH